MKKWALASVAVWLSMSLACSKSPDTPSVSFAAPVGSQPANGANVKYGAQPLTLTIANAARTGTATATYTIEVATDAAFTNKVYTKTGIVEGSGGTTAITIGSLPGSATYYWHSMTEIDGVTGAPSATQSFTVGPPVIINTPSISSPASGATVFSIEPTLVVNNATRSGPVSQIFYEFQVSTDSSFSSLVASGTTQEQAGDQTSWTTPSNVPTGTLYWRARATDPTDGVTTDFTSPVSFQAGIFDMTQATMEDNPPDVPFWAQTAAITSIVFTPSSFEVDFTKRTGPGAWPESSFGTGGIQYTLGMCANLNSHWYCSAVVQFWAGRDLDDSGLPTEIALNWFYDPRWGPLQGYQPNWGDQVGIFVAQGNLRDDGNTTLQERSNVVVIPWGSNYFAPGVDAAGSSAHRPLSVRIKH